MTPVVRDVIVHLLGYANIAIGGYELLGLRGLWLLSIAVGVKLLWPARA